MPAGFLITRLLLVCLLSDVGYKSHATAQQVAQTQLQHAQRPADYMISPYAHQMQSKDAQGNPWVKLVEGLVRNHGFRLNQHPQSPYQQHPQSPYQQHPQSPYQQHPQSPYQQQPQSPYQQQPHSPYPQQGLKYPTAVLSSQPHPGVEPKKIEFNMNIPLHYILRGIAQSKKAPEWLYNVQDGADSSQIKLPNPEEVSGLARPDRKNVMTQLKRKVPSDPSNSGFHIKLTAPIKSLRDKSMNLQRSGTNDQEPVQLGLPEFGPDWPVMHQGLGPHQGLVQNPQHTQFQPHLSLFRHLLYPQRLHDPSLGHGPLQGPQNPTPVNQNPTPVILNPSLGLQNPTPVNQNPTPVILDPSLGLQNPTPVLNKPSVGLQNPTPLNPNPPLAQPQTERIPSEMQGGQSVGLLNQNHQTKQQVLVVDQIQPPHGSMANPRFGPRASRGQTAPRRWILCPQYFVR